MEQPGISTGMSEAYKRRRQRAAKEAQLLRTLGQGAGVVAPAAGTALGGLAGLALGNPMVGMGIGGALGSAAGGLAAGGSEMMAQNKMTPYEEAEAKRKAKLQALMQYLPNA